MVATEQEEILRVLYFIGQQEANCLEGLLATIDVVAEEQVVGIGRETTILEKSQKIIVLTMDITYLPIIIIGRSYRIS